MRVRRARCLASGRAGTPARLLVYTRPPSQKRKRSGKPARGIDDTFGTQQRNRVPPDPSRACRVDEPIKRQREWVKQRGSCVRGFNEIIPGVGCQCIRWQRALLLIRLVRREALISVTRYSALLCAIQKRVEWHKALLFNIVRSPICLLYLLVTSAFRSDAI